MSGLSGDLAHAASAALKRDAGTPGPSHLGPGSEANPRMAPASGQIPLIQRQQFCPRYLAGPREFARRFRGTNPLVPKSMHPEAAG